MADINTTLDGYRAKYRENRGYAALTNILARTSTFNMWDDHEVVNDFAGTTVDPAMLRDGRQAFREYMPMTGDDSDEQMYRAFRWGADIDPTEECPELGPVRFVDDRTIEVTLPHAEPRTIAL